MQQFIPRNLDIDSILNQYPPPIKKFKRNYLVYILHLIIAIPATNKDSVSRQGYVSLSSKLLQNRIRNYRSYLNYLLERRIICTDNHYINDKKCIGYKFTETYSGEVKLITVHDLRLQAAIKRESQLPAALKKKYGHLFKWYEGLEIDRELALDYITQDRDRKLENPRLCDFDAKVNNFKNPDVQFAAASVNIENIAAGEFRLSVDDTVYRLHSAISNVRSAVRNCITYQGNKLVSIDIKNSQPYLSTVILTPEFWAKDEKKGSARLQNIKITDIYNNKSINIFSNNKSIDSYTMLCKSAEMQADSDLQRYRKLVSEGAFYEDLQKEPSKELNINFDNRKQVKAAVLQVLFTDNRFFGQAKAVPKKLFKALFPKVYDLFAKIKRSDKTNLPKLLQRIESHMMLLVIAKRIAYDNPDLPIFTIHDSIITTSGNEAYVAQVVKEEMEKAIGFPPQLSVDEWSPENLEFNDGTPYFRKQIVAA